ncbi:MAG: response regulator [Anaerolineae bacterium]|jgi:CheY-like chemotaxis protein|nr:response regulator [Anaerolineae bacterium]
MERRLVLIADDDVDALKLVGLMLERQGYAVAVASSGQQAIQKALEMQPALIVLDVMMPDMDGYEVVTKLRNHPATESIPILMFTARAAVNDRVAGLQAGADDYLTKPVRPKEFAARVETLLERQAPPRDEQKRGRVIGFLGAKGGTGTSTLVINTAVELMHMHPEASAALVELQDGAAVLAYHMGLDTPTNAAPGLPTLLSKPLSYLTADRVRQAMVRHASGLRVLLASPEPAGTGIPCSRGHVRSILKYLRAESDYVLLDLPPRLDEPQREAVALCDRVILAVEPNRAGVALTETMTAALERLGIMRQKIRATLIHRAPASGTVSLSMIEQMIRLEMIAAIPPVPDLAYASLQNGRSMVEMQPQSLIAQQIRRVVQDIVED